VNKRKRCPWKRKHHNWEEARHKHSCTLVSSKEAMQISVKHFTSCIRKITDLEPSNRIKYMVKSKRNQQAVCRTEDKSSNSTE